MHTVEPIRTFDQIKLLADSRRMAILRFLMASPATLTQLARTLGQSPAWIRHHIKSLEAANLVEIAEIRTTGTVTEKYYRAKASALLLQELILPTGKKPAVIFSGSHDLALESIAEYLQPHIMLLSMPVGSLDGLVSARDCARSRARTFSIRVANTIHRSSGISSPTGIWKLSRLRIARRDGCSQAAIPKE